MENVKNRPAGITILAALQIIFGILFLLGAIGMFLIASLADAADLEEAIGEDAPDWISDNFVMAFGLLGVLFLIIGIVGLVLGYGYLKGIGWAWTVGIVFAVLGIIGDIFESMVDRTADVLASSIIGIIIALLIIYYLTRPHVKAFFGKT
jgi:tryptophan-rich sensory protein